MIDNKIYIRVVCSFVLIFMMLFFCSNAAAEEKTQGDGSGLSAANAQAQKYQTYDSLFTLYQPYLKNLGPYQPIYFLFGTNPKKSKFQFSFKYKFYNPQDTLPGDNNWREGFYFAYTQTSFWDLKSDSKPFEDTSYKPELFFISPNIYSGTQKLSRLFLKTGFQHESNGKSENSSRSTNFIYFEPSLIFYEEDTSLGLQIFPRVWTYIENDDQTNEDLKDYRGYFDLGVKIGKANSLVIESHFRAARKGNSLDLNFTYPMNINNFELYLHVQYSNILAESLVSYKERNQAFRIRHPHIPSIII